MSGRGVSTGSQINRPLLASVFATSIAESPFTDRGRNKYFRSPGHEENMENMKKASSMLAILVAAMFLQPAHRFRPYSCINAMTLWSNIHYWNQD